MKQYNLSITICIFAHLLICTPSFAQPTITSFAPTSGPIGTTVTITGTNFNTTPANNIVFFGATMATVSAATATSLTVTVPIGTTYEYITVTNLTTNLTAYSARPFIVTFSCGTNSFDPKVDFTAGTNPWGVAISDLDGDGKSDLAVTNYGAATVSIFLNTGTSGTISFAPNVDFTTGTNPVGVVTIGDLDGDGKPDLVVANSFSNTVSAFRNTSTIGNISFAAKVDFTAVSGPEGVAIGDLDGDGKPDLAVTNYIFNNIISTFLNTSTIGNISFAAKVDFTTGTQPYVIVMADLDGNGKPDIAAENFGSNTVSIFRNTSIVGTISFAAKVDLTTGMNPSGLAVGDLDGNGKPDLAVTNWTSNTVSTFRNTSVSGTISFAAKVDFATGTQPHSVAIGDLDGNGKPDLVVTNYGSATVSTFNNTSVSGTISFAAKVDFITGTQPRGVAIGDLDGDNMPDFALANYSSTTVSTFRNQCSVLPIELLSFTGYNEGGKNVLEWITASESNNNYFDIERTSPTSINPKGEEEWLSIGTVKGAVNSNTVMQYEFIDKYPLSRGDKGVCYYRLKQVNFDGSFTYSNTIAIANETKQMLAVFPNPANDNLFCKLTAGTETIMITDVFGNVVMKGEVQANRQANCYTLSIAHLPRGMYFLQAGDTQAKFVKQ